MPVLHCYKEIMPITVIGSSELGEEIPMITIGSGKKKFLVWSQMHGNESTTTKALLDFLKLIAQQQQESTAIEAFLKTHTVKIIPILNPDGARAYTRVNANGVDLNRDAQLCSQKESKALREVFDAFQPDLCLNMHDQRTIYGLPSGKSATVSFLSPSADASRGLTKAREVAMLDIAKMANVLATVIPGQIGKYDDGFNLNCVGDTFTHLGVPTILFEAGHYPGDYSREITRSYIYRALLVVFTIEEVANIFKVGDYLQLPENEKSFCDIVLKDVRLLDEEAPQDIAIQYIESLKDGKIDFQATLLELRTNLIGHTQIACNGDYVVLNNGNNVRLNESICKVYNKSKGIELLINI